MNAVRIVYSAVNASLSADTFCLDNLFLTTENTKKEADLSPVELLQMFCAHLPKSSLIQCQAARYCIELRAHRQKIAMHLVQAAAKRPSLDLQFAMFCIQSVLDESYDSDAQQLGLHRYLKFRNLNLQASKEVVTAARCQQRFFTELLLPTPDMQRMREQGRVGFDYMFTDARVNGSAETPLLTVIVTFLVLCVALQLMNESLSAANGLFLQSLKIHKNAEVSNLPACRNYL